MRLILCSVWLLALAACERATPAPPPSAEAAYVESAAAMPDERVIAAIEGHRLIYPGPLPHDVATGESFFCSGNWSRNGGRSSEGGTYAVVNGEICTIGARRDQCRRFLRREGDVVYLSVPGSTDEAAFRVRREAYCARDPNGGPSIDITTVTVRGEQSMDQAEVAQLVRGASIYAVPNGAENYETFACNGAWVAIGSRGPIHGGYEIRDGDVCLRGPAGNTCSRFYQRHGAYYRGEVMPNGEVALAIRVQITPNEACTP